jgi:hypothetical protein
MNSETEHHIPIHEHDEPVDYLNEDNQPITFSQGNVILSDGKFIASCCIISLCIIFIIVLVLSFKLTKSRSRSSGSSRSVFSSVKYNI